MKQREVFPDILRTAATCAVVLLHTVTGVMDHTDMLEYPVQIRIFQALLDLSCWCVPVFVMISGYFFLDPKRELTFRLMLTKYCRRIALALLLFGVPFAWLELIMRERTFRIGMIGEGFLMVLRGQTWSHMWYLYLILFLYLLTPVLRWLLSRLAKPVIWGILAVLFLGSSVQPYLMKLLSLELPTIIPDWGIYFFYYVCGYLFAVKDQKGQESSPKTGKICMLLFFLLLAGMTASRFVGDYTLQLAYNYPFTAVAALLLFGWAAEDFGKRVFVSGEDGGIFWQRISGLCFGIYLIHPVFLNLLYKFLHVTPLSVGAGLSLPLFFLGILLPAALGAWVMKKIPVLDRYVL